MSVYRARFLLTIGALATMLCTSSSARAERRPAWRGTSFVQLTAAREGLAPGAARLGGPLYPVDETYAGPWAYSPFATSPRAAVRDAVSPPERAPAPASAAGNASSAYGARNVDGLLSRLGPIGLLASIVVPAAVASSGGSRSRAGKGVTARVGFAKLAGGYGIVIAGRFLGRRATGLVPPRTGSPGQCSSR